MKLIYKIYCVLVGLLLITFSHAQNVPNKSQQVQLSGTIQAATTKQPIEGVTIADAARKVLAVSGRDGSYTVTVSAGTTLYFTAIGYTTESMVAEKSSGGQLILLQTNSKDLDNVVVTTALGITRQQKALGYSVQKLDEGDLLTARPNNWAAALSGKVAGLNLLSAGSGPLNSTRISLRGDASLNPDGNNALIVLDGVPMNSGATTSGVDNAYGAGAGNDVRLILVMASPISTRMILKASRC